MLYLETYLKLQARMSPSFDLSLSGITNAKEHEFEVQFKDHIKKWFQEF